MKSFTFLALSAAAGVALVTFASATFTAYIPAEIVLSGAVGFGILGLMISDYRRCARSLRVATRIVRPAACFAAAPRSSRTTAYGVSRQSALVERTAA